MKRIARFAVAEIAQRSVAFVVGGVAPHGGSRDTAPVELVGHEAGVGDADAEAEGPHGRQISDALAELAR